MLLISKQHTWPCHCTTPRLFRLEKPLYIFIHLNDTFSAVHIVCSATFSSVSEGARNNRPRRTIVWFGWGVRIQLYVNNCDIFIGNAILQCKHAGCWIALPGSSFCSRGCRSHQSHWRWVTTIKRVVLSMHASGRQSVKFSDMALVIVTKLTYSTCRLLLSTRTVWAAICDYFRIGDWFRIN